MTHQIFHDLDLAFAHLQVVLIVDIHPLQGAAHPLVHSHQEHDCKSTFGNDLFHGDLVPPDGEAPANEIPARMTGPGGAAATSRTGPGAHQLATGIEELPHGAEATGGVFVTPNVMNPTGNLRDSLARKNLPILGQVEPTVW